MLTKLGALVMLLLAPALASAQVAFSTLGPGKTYSGKATNLYFGAPNSTVGNIVVGNGFTAGATGRLSSIDVALGYESGSPNAATVNLHAADGPGGELGTLLGSWDVSNLPSRASGGGLFTLPATTTIPIQSGEDYWLTIWPAGSATSDTTGYFMDSANSVTAPWVFSPDGGYTFRYGLSGQAGAFQINLVPEPGLLLTLAAGMFLVASTRRR